MNAFNLPAAAGEGEFFYERVKLQTIFVGWYLAERDLIVAVEFIPRKNRLKRSASRSDD
jgi:hypothetical protein